MIIFSAPATEGFPARLDPRVRVAFVAVFATLICLCERRLPLAAALAAGAAVLGFSGVSAAPAARRLVPLNVFMLLLAVTLPVFVPGHTVFRFAGLAWSSAGLLHAARIAARANAVMLMLTGLLATLPPPHLGFALNGLGVPGKFTHLLLFMIRYTEIIHHEYHRLRDAMLLRGFRPRTNRHTLRTFGYLIGQLLVRSVSRSERILAAMKCRGFRGRFYMLEPGRIGWRDVVFSVPAFGFLILLASMEWR